MTRDITILSESKYIEWKIKNFFELPTDVDNRLTSASFSFSEATWCLSIYPNGQTKDEVTGWIGLYINKLKSIYECDITCELGIKETDGTDFSVGEFNHTFQKEEVGWGFSKHVEKSKLLNSKSNVAPDGTLTVFCNLINEDNSLITSSPKDSESQTHSDGTLTLVDDLKNLYLSSNHADVTIIVKEKEFRAHRSILSSRSSVFGSMFLHDMEEKNSGTVKISDCNPDTFEDFLLFLYTGKLDSVSSSNALSLYRTADKYDVKELRDECVRCMINELSIDLFCDVLHLAVTQNENDVLKAVTTYFIDNAKTIVLTAKWQTFLAENPVIGNELFYKLLISKDNIEK